jgi:uracil-DNA glycosylase
MRKLISSMNTAAEMIESEILTWKEVLVGEKEKDYFVSLLQFVESERTRGKQIYPKNSEIFNALTMTPFQEVKVVVLGQDPYHGPGQAHGLSFSVLPPTPPPPSLLNIFLELKSDLGIPRPTHGSLESWARQGVLLLNAVLTVEDGRPGSHANKGWEQFTDRVIQELNSRRTGLVFLLWGAYAQKKAAFVDRAKHCVLAAPHPSPLSAHRGFLGCRHFSRANEFLALNGHQPIDWKAE